MKKTFLLTMLAVLLSWTGASFAAPPAKTGFLVVAPDRGFLGNREVDALFAEFARHYPAALAYVGRGYGGPDRDYAPYFEAAMNRLAGMNVERVVAVPLYLTASNPALDVARGLVAAKKAFKPVVQWAKPMAASYLTAQIFLDRVRQWSREPEKERLILLAMGPMDAASEKAIGKELQPILQYATDRLPFRKAEVMLYYNYGAEEKLRKQKNEETDRRIIESAAKKGNTILIPFALGPKFSHRMSLTHWLANKFKDHDLTFASEEILQHPNVMHWMRKTANLYVATTPQQVGVVIMPHGAQKPYNDAVEKVIAPLKRHYRVEMAYGMADAWTLQDAVQTLEREGIRKVVVVRMYSLKDQFRGQVDYILGSTPHPPRQRGGAEPPPQVRSGAVFATFGGYEEDALICEILRERVMAVSRDPAWERVLLIAHGSRDDKKDAEWKTIMQIHADYIQKNTEVPFKDIRGLTVREDWPDKREQALKNIRALIQEGSETGRTLIISNRLYGSGRYDEFFEGLTYEMNRDGLAPHENLTRWLEQGIQRIIEEGFKYEEQPVTERRKPDASARDTG